MKKEQNRRESLRRIKHTVGCNASKRRRRRRTRIYVWIFIQIKNHKQETTVIFPLALFFSTGHKKMTGYFHMLTRSAPRMLLRFVNIIIIIIIIITISIFSCDAMKLLITAAKWCERQEKCDETPKTWYILRMVMEMAKQDSMKPVFKPTVQNEQNSRKSVSADRSLRQD
jgi:hypothetical protein